MHVPTHSSAYLALALLPAVAGAANPTFSIDPSADAKPISSYIYGLNTGGSGAFAGRQSVATLARIGGNRTTTYNWETNASNAGADWYFENDNFWSSSNTPGEGVRPTIQAAQNNSRALILTVPTIGYVAADKLGGNDVSGDVRLSGPNYLTTRFKQSLPTDPNRGASAFPNSPNPSDAYVYQDEFVNWVKKSWPSSQTDPKRPIWYSLDNEPDIWAGTHAPLRGNTVPRSYATGNQPITYAELIQKTVAYATAIKAVSPSAKVFGPDNYGWLGTYNLQNAPDAAGRDFVTYYLQQMKQAETDAGKRLVDDFDFHWYPEITVNGIRVTDNTTNPAVIAARLQAPRSMWDPTFKEDSWITRDVYKFPLNFLPTLQGKINANYPGTKIAITEYNYGGSADVSGGVTQADVLGIFGKQGVDVAAYWPLTSDISYALGGFDLYRNYDGQNHTFGDTSIRANNTDTVNASVYAATDSTDAHRLTVVALNKQSTAATATLAIAGSKIYRWADVFQLTSASSFPQFAGRVFLASPNSLLYTMPSLSGSALVFSDLLPGDANADGTITSGDLATLLNGINAHLTGWNNGDFSGDGVINADDYILYQWGVALQAQGGPAVPEPAAAATTLAAFLALSQRRRRPA
jgi:hypothetical protein